jgi:hypothetical protein
MLRTFAMIGDSTDLKRRTKMLLVAIMALAAILIPNQQRAEAGEVCVGSECDTVAFVDGGGVFTLYKDLSPASLVGRFYYGNPGDYPFMGDWNGDGTDTPGLYRQSDGYAYLRNSNTQGIANTKFFFGNPGDVPIAGDFNGDGYDTVSIYRPSNQRFYIINELGSNSGGLGAADFSFTFGGPGDTPLVGDFDGDGVDTAGIFRPSTGLVALSNTHSSVVDYQYYFGGSGDKVLVGDWDGYGDDTIALYRPSDGRVYVNNYHRSGAADYSVNVGRNHLRAVAAGGISTVPSGVVSVPGITPPPPRQSSGPIHISGESNVVIENLHISNPDGDCVYVSGSSDVVIKNSTIGPCGDDAVYVTDSDNVQVYGNYITDTGNGVLVHRSDSIIVDGNAFVNAGRNFVQFDKVNGAGSSISGNRGQNELGGSSAEDLINLYQSNGTASSPIRVVGNYLRNGGPSDYGSGIMLGDEGGSHQIAQGNRLINPGQVGIGVAGGDDMKVIDNLIYSSAQPWSNVGIFAWDFSVGCGSVEISGNQIDWTAAGGYSNGFWNGGGCDLSRYNNDWDANLGPGIW